MTTDSCLSVIAQTFMDSCSLNENILGKLTILNIAIIIITIIIITIITILNNAIIIITILVIYLHCETPGKDSPSSKLLFAKDIPLYRQVRHHHHHHHLFPLIAIISLYIPNLILILLIPSWWLTSTRTSGLCQRSPTRSSTSTCSSSALPIRASLTTWPR